jgi:DNA polymerase-1
MSRVPPEGRKDAKLIIVGEAPGSTEAYKGRPFVGKAGQLLDTILLSTGISRSSCYITNVVKERPYKNNIGQFLNFKRNSVEETDEYKCYEKELFEELKQVESHVIVALGKVPLYALTGKEKITKERGSLLKPKPGIGLDDKIIIPAIHPAACLRQYIFKIMLMFDFGRIKKVIETPFEKINIDQEELHKRIITNPSVSQAKNWIAEYSKKSLITGTPISFDIEVINLEVASIGLSYWNDNEKTAISIAFKEGKDLYSPESELELMIAIGRLLEDSSIKKLGQNLMFDIDFLFRKYGIRTQNIEDTMLAQAILTPDLPKGLDFICSIYTNIPYYKDEGKIWKGVGGNFEEFWLYNGKDCIVCSIAWPKLKEDLKKQGNWETYQRQRDVIIPLVYAQNRGINIDMEKLKLVYKETEEKIKILQKELNELAGRELNPNSPKQLKTYFYVEKNFTPYRSQGKITTNELAMKRIVRKGSKEASIVVEIRKLRKLLGTYYDPAKVDSDGRLRTNFQPVGTLNGRLSSRETIFGTGMNVQNVPGVMKKYMIFDPGYIGYEIDLGQAENRLVAYFSNEHSMIQAFENNVDIHSQTGAMIYKHAMGEEISISEIKRQHNEGIKAPLGNGSRSWRYWGKQANHGLNYDEGYKTFSLRNEIPEKDGKLIVDTYHKTYPGVRQWHKRIIKELGKNRTLINPFGRKRKFLDRWGDQMFKQAYNYKPQSTVADIINLYGVEYSWREMPEYFELINQVHDSIVFQIPTSIPLKHHAELIRQMINSLETPITIQTGTFVIPAELSVGFNFKDLEEIDVIDENLEYKIEEIYERYKRENRK